MAEVKMIVAHESVFASVVKDTFTFGSIGVLIALNHKFWGGHAWIDIMFTLFILVWGATKSSKSISRFNSYEDAKKFVNSKAFKPE
jgi:Co/Zn/Cd efflux system component